MAAAGLLAPATTPALTLALTPALTPALTLAPMAASGIVEHAAGARVQGPGIVEQAAGLRIGSGRTRSGLDSLQLAASALAGHRPRVPVWTVEFGAGAGELSRQLAIDATSLATGPLGGQVLLDRSCGRGGAMQAVLDGDRWEDKDSRLLSGRTLRLRVDIRHVHLAGLAEIQGVDPPSSTPDPHPGTDPDPGPGPGPRP